jgi:hypothetical protein
MGMLMDKKIAATAKPKRRVATPKALKIADISAAFDAAIGPFRDSITKLVEKMESRVAAPRIVHVDEPAPSVATMDGARLEALLVIFSGRGAQQVLQDMLDTGNAPTRPQLLQLADEMIARSAGRAG